MPEMTTDQRGVEDDMTSRGHRVKIDVTAAPLPPSPFSRRGRGRHCFGVRLSPGSDVRRQIPGCCHRRRCRRGACRHRPWHRHQEASPLQPQPRAGARHRQILAHGHGREEGRVQEEDAQRQDQGREEAVQRAAAEEACGGRRGEAHRRRQERRHAQSQAAQDAALLPNRGRPSQAAVPRQEAVQQAQALPPLLHRARHRAHPADGQASRQASGVPEAVGIGAAARHRSVPCEPRAPSPRPPEVCDRHEHARGPVSAVAAPSPHGRLLQEEASAQAQASGGRDLRHQEGEVRAVGAAQAGPEAGGRAAAAPAEGGAAAARVSALPLFSRLGGLPPQARLLRRGRGDRVTPASVRRVVSG